MTTHVIEVGGRPAVRARAGRRPRVAAHRSLLDVIRWAAAVVLLVLGLCGLAAAADMAGAGATPPEGPAPGLDL